MKPENTITISITIPNENGSIYTHSVVIPDDGVDYNVSVEDGLREFLELARSVWGGIAVESLIEKYQLYFEEE